MSTFTKMQVKSIMSKVVRYTKVAVDRVTAADRRGEKLDYEKVLHEVYRENNFDPAKSMQQIRGPATSRYGKAAGKPKQPLSVSQRLDVLEQEVAEQHAAKYAKDQHAKGKRIDLASEVMFRLTYAKKYQAAKDDSAKAAIAAMAMADRRRRNGEEFVEFKRLHDDAMQKIAAGIDPLS